MENKTPNSGYVSPAKVAVIQFDPQVGTQNIQKNNQKSIDLAQNAADKGATLIVLPELSNTGYTFDSREDAYNHAEPIPSQQTTKLWIDFCAKNKVYLTTGITEIEGITLYDTAILVGPNGLIGKYRKTHLWNEEKLWFTAGNLGYPVFDTPIGRIGLLICWDIWFPEVPRILTQQGADIICSLNNWVWTPPPLFDELGRCMASYLTMTAAHVNNVFIAAANRIGKEKDGKGHFLGCSLIASTNGWPIGKVASADEQTIIYADIDITSSRSARIWNNLNDLDRDRRTDLYDQLLGYEKGTALPR